MIARELLGEGSAPASAPASSRATAATNAATGATAAVTAAAGVAAATAAAGVAAETAATGVAAATAAAAMPASIIVPGASASVPTATASEPAHPALAAFAAARGLVPGTDAMFDLAIRSTAWAGSTKQAAVKLGQSMGRGGFGFVTKGQLGTPGSDVAGRGAGSVALKVCIGASAGALNDVRKEAEMLISWMGEAHCALHGLRHAMWHAVHDDAAGQGHPGQPCAAAAWPVHGAGVDTGPPGDARAQQSARPPPGALRHQGRQCVTVSRRSGQHVRQNLRSGTVQELEDGKVGWGDPRVQCSGGGGWLGLHMHSRRVASCSIAAMWLEVRSGQPPFAHLRAASVSTRVVAERQGSLAMVELGHAAYASLLDSDELDMLARCLVSTDKRASVQQLLEHPFFV